MKARQATFDDIPFIAELGRECYPQYALRGAEEWLAKVMSFPGAAVFIADQAVATVACQREFWNPNGVVSDVLPMFGKPSEDNPLGVYTALMAAIEWSKDQGCYGTRFGSSVGALSPGHERNSVDLMEVFARRMGAHPWGLTYMKEFHPCLRQSQ